ncbi:MAG: DUF4043 family protein [bacterium]
MATPVPQTDAIVLGKLSTSILNQYEQALFFTHFQSDVIRNKKGELSPPVSPIVRRREFESPIGQTKLTIPALKNYNGDPHYGQAIVTGKGEKDKWDVVPVYINDIVFPYEGPGAVDEQRVKVLRLLARARDRLALRLAQEDEIQTVSAFYEGRSRNVTASTANNGLGKNKLYHPNFYSASSGLATWSGTVQTHANNIGAKLDELAPNNIAHEMSVKNLELLRSVVQDIPLDPVVISGKPYYPMLLHSNQMRQLRNDPLFNENNSRAEVRGKDNPLFAMAEGYYANFLLYERFLSVFGVNAALSGGNYTLTFGATSPIKARDKNPLKCAIVFGTNAISKGMVGGPRIGEQDQNIQGFKEFAIRQMIGMARNTMYDVDPDDATPSTQLEQGSLIFATYSDEAWA